MVIEPTAPIESISYLTDSAGKRISVVISIEKYAAFVEDFIDIQHSRIAVAENDFVSLDEFKEMITEQKKQEAEQKVAADV